MRRTASDEEPPAAVGAVLVFGVNRGERLGAQRTLLAQGYSVLLASSMAEAAKCIASGRVRAIVLTDDGIAASVDGRPLSSAPDSLRPTNIPLIRHNAPLGEADAAAARALLAAVEAAMG